MLSTDATNTANATNGGTSPDEKERGSPVSLSKVRRIVLVATLASAGFLNIFTVQSTVIMLPSIGRSLNIPASRQQWITSAYNVAFGCVLLVWGRLADILGRKKIFLIGSSMVSIFTLVIPFTQSEIAFDVLRAFQGAAGAATVPSTVGILGSTFPEGKQRTYAFITYTAASSLGSVFGNIIGGIIGSFLTWKWTFWLIAIFAAFVTVMAAFSVPGTLPEARKRVYVDVFGAILISSSLVLVLVALSEGNTVGWRVPWIIVILVLSIMLLAAFILWQRYLEHQTSRAPLIKTSMFKDMQLSAALVVVGLFFPSYNSYLIFTTLFFQDLQGLTTIQTTLRFLPAGVTGFLICFVTARLLSIVPGFYNLIFAILCGTVSPLLFAVPIEPHTTYWVYGFPAMCLCISADVLAPTLNLFIIRRLPSENRSIGGGLISTFNQVGRTLGLAIATAVQSATGHAESSGAETWNPALLRGYRAAQWVNVALTTAAMAIILVAFRNMKQVGAEKSGSKDEEKE